VRVHTDLAELLWASGQRSEAAELFRSIRELGATLSPDDSASLDNLAWSLASAPVPEWRDIPRAVAIAARSAERCPDGRNGWHTIAVARYRAGEYRAAVEALERMQERPDSFVGEAELFLAMALWQLGDRDAARAHYDRGADWLDQHIIPISQVVRHRREAEALLGVGEPRRPARSPPGREQPRGSPEPTADGRLSLRP
jgi:tetratricopeptide (TPR) repeat protein